MSSNGGDVLSRAEQLLSSFRDLAKSYSDTFDVPSSQSTSHFIPTVRVSSVSVSDSIPRFGSVAGSAEQPLHSTAIHDRDNLESSSVAESRLPQDLQASRSSDAGAAVDGSPQHRPVSTASSPDAGMNITASNDGKVQFSEYVPTNYPDQSILEVGNDAGSAELLESTSEYVALDEPSIPQAFRGNENFAHDKDGISEALRGYPRPTTSAGTRRTWDTPQTIIKNATETSRSQTAAAHGDRRAHKHDRDSITDADMMKLHKACTVIQAAWRGYYARSTDYRVALARREIRSRRMEQHIRVMSDDIQILDHRISASDEKRQLQHDALQIIWEKLTALTCDHKREEDLKRRNAAIKIQTIWRGYQSRKIHGASLRQRLMENLNGTQRLRAAVRAGNTTALVELCLHLQDQVNTLNKRLTQIAYSQPEALVSR